MHTYRRVARIWKRGGLFWNSEKCANDLDSNFHWPWISIRRFVRNLRRNVSEIQRFFPPKIRWSPKKKKKKKKKGLRQNSGQFFFFQFRKFKVRGGALFVWGGAIFHFSQKIGLKSTKNMRFCILHKPMGGLEPPRPPWLRYCIHTVLLCWTLFCFLQCITPFYLLSQWTAKIEVRYVPNLRATYLEPYRTSVPYFSSSFEAYRINLPYPYYCKKGVPYRTAILTFGYSQLFLTL